MASIVVAFEDAWITLASNPTLSVHASFPQRGSKSDTAGEVRFYAGGRSRVITSANRSATFPLTLQLLSDDDLDLLTSWSGRVLLLRDGEGRRTFGTYLSLDVTDWWDADGTLHDVAFTFTQLSYDEAVI